MDEEIKVNGDLIETEEAVEKSLSRIFENFRGFST